MAEAWKKCTECRIDIDFGATYYQCSVSTCNRARMPLVFCSVVCWDCHLSSVRHRDAGAIEAKAPSKAQWERELAEKSDEHERPTVPARPAETPKEPARQAAPAARPGTAPGVVSSEPAVPRSAGVPEPIRPTRSDETRPNLVPPPPDVQRRVVGAPSTSPAAPPVELTLSDNVEKDVLIVVSKMKKYIKDRSGFNTSDQIVDLLSDHVRAICDEAIRAAARDDRKTVLERDVPRAPRRT